MGLCMDIYSYRGYHMLLSPVENHTDKKMDNEMDTLFI